MHPKVWEASGHVAGFTDPLVDCARVVRSPLDPGIVRPETVLTTWRQSTSGSVKPATCPERLPPPWDASGWRRRALDVVPACTIAFHQRSFTFS